MGGGGGNDHFLHCSVCIACKNETKSVSVYLHCAENQEIVADLLCDLIHVAADEGDIALTQIRTSPSHVVLVLKKLLKTLEIGIPCGRKVSTYD